MTSVVWIQIVFMKQNAVRILVRCCAFSLHEVSYISFVVAFHKKKQCPCAPSPREKVEKCATQAIEFLESGSLNFFCN